MPIRELTHGTQIDLVLLVQSVERRPRKSGEDFLKIVFVDRTGSLQSNVWDDVDEIERLLIVGAPFRVGGKFEVHEKFGAQLKLEGFVPAEEGTFDPSELRAGPPVPVPELEARLRSLIASVTDPGMAAVLEATLGEGTETWAAYRVAPAAKRVHQAYRHGLLEHCLTVAEAVAGAAGVFPGIDRDLAVSAALIHDIGKLDAYAFGDGDVVELTDAGKLRGEIVIGYERMHGILNGIPLIDEVRKQAFLHIILAHHGQLEHGSPVTPQTREAFLVHTMDNLGGKLGIVDRLDQERAPGSAWSGYDRAFGGSVWFAEDAEPPPPPVGSGHALGHEHAPQQPPVLRGHGDPVPAAPAPAAPAAPALADVAVPRGAFEDSEAWRPPSPDELTAPPLPQESLTAPPEHDEPVIPASQRPEPPSYTGERDAPPAAPAAPSFGAERAGTAVDSPAPAPIRPFEVPERTEAPRGADAPPAEPERGDPRSFAGERPERELASAPGDARRGGPPPPPDAQPLPF